MMLDNEAPVPNPNEARESKEPEKTPETKHESPTERFDGIKGNAERRSGGIKGLLETLRGRFPKVGLRRETEEMQTQEDNLKALSEYTESQLSQPKPTERRSRLGLASRLHAEMLVRSPEVRGVENLTNIPKNKGVVIATTHLSDIDTEAIAANASKYRAVSATSQSANQEIFVIGGLMRFAAGSEIYDIKGKFDTKTQKPKFRLTPTNFEAMRKPLEKGRALIVPAHNPAYNWHLPERPGLGAVLAAQQLEEPLIVPAALDIDNQDGKIPAAIVSDALGTMKRLATGNRPDTKLAYGEPLRLEKIDPTALKNMMKLFTAESRHTLSKEGRIGATETLKKIQGQAEEVMRSLATLLPPEKRGSWGSTETTENDATS
jgi:hypothetical protein